MQDGWSPKPQSNAGIRELRDIASASSSTNAPPKQKDIDDAGTGQDDDHEIDFGGWRRSKGEGGSGSTPKSESSDETQETGANGANGGDNFSRYRVCMEGGVPILQEADAHEGDGDVYDVGDDDQAAAVATRGQENNASFNHNSGISVSGSPEIANHGTRRMEREAKAGGARVVPSSGLVGPMTDGEMAGGMMFGIGNDLRVSI